MVDALLRREEMGECKAILVVVSDWIREVSNSYEQTSWARDLMTRLAAGPQEHKGYTLKVGLLRYKGRLVIGMTLSSDQEYCKPCTPHQLGDIRV